MFFVTVSAKLEKKVADKSWEDDLDRQAFYADHTILELKSTSIRSDIDSSTIPNLSDRLNYLLSLLLSPTVSIKCTATHNGIPYYYDEEMIEFTNKIKELGTIGISGLHDFGDNEELFVSLIDHWLAYHLYVGDITKGDNEEYSFDIEWKW